MKKCSLKLLVKNVLILFLFIVVLHIIFNSLLAKKEFVTKEYVVIPGDTLWSIASDMMNEDNTDIYRIMYDIKEINNMSDSILYTGQTIYVPIYEI